MPMNFSLFQVIKYLAQFTAGISTDNLRDVLDFLRRVSALENYPGLYEVLDYEASLELLDLKGQRAVYTKRERVRFLQNNVIAYQDQAWGDGSIFADYQCVPGKAVDRYREGHRYWVLISLRESKQRGDIEDIHITRTITGGFTQKTEEWQTEVNHRMRNMTIRLLFPKHRAPKRVSLVEQNTSRVTPLGLEHIRALSDGRTQVAWRMKKPKLFEAYILRWEW